MPLGTVRQIWCHTCEEYVRPGSHGLHAMRYGQPATLASPASAVGDGTAVALIVAVVSGTGIFIVVVAMLLSQASR